jgi:L-ascorbate metabolism protein UlaG (beta-lactamase superfamily)
MAKTPSSRTGRPGAAAPLRDLGIDVTTLGGPTAVLDIGGVRFLVDPTFDPPGEYPVGSRSLMKTEPSAWAPEQVGRVDAVLLSHDQHPDNLDHAGRKFLLTVPRILTTATAATRLEGRVEGLDPWESTVLGRPGGGTLQVTATPAQHGPPGTEHLTGPVIGFMLTGPDLPTVYISGDNASLDVVRAVRAHFPTIDFALLFAGGAKTALLGDAYLTLSSAMAAEAVHILGEPPTVVVHTDGWAHFTESSASLPDAFREAGVGHALIRLAQGKTATL